MHYNNFGTFTYFVGIDKHFFVVMEEVQTKTLISIEVEDGYISHPLSHISTSSSSPEFYATDHYLHLKSTAPDNNGSVQMEFVVYAYTKLDSNNIMKEEYPVKSLEFTQNSRSNVPVRPTSQPWTCSSPTRNFKVYQIHMLEDNTMCVLLKGRLQRVKRGVLQPERAGLFAFLFIYDPGYKWLLRVDYRLTTSAPEALSVLRSLMNGVQRDNVRRLTDLVLDSISGGQHVVTVSNWFITALALHVGLHIPEATFTFDRLDSPDAYTVVVCGGQFGIRVEGDVMLWGLVNMTGMEELLYMKYNERDVIQSRGGKDVSAFSSVLNVSKRDLDTALISLSESGECIVLGPRNVKRVLCFETYQGNTPACALTDISFFMYNDSDTARNVTIVLKVPSVYLQQTENSYLVETAIRTYKDNTYGDVVVLYLMRSPTTGPEVFYNGQYDTRVLDLSSAPSNPSSIIALEYRVENVMSELNTVPHDSWEAKNPVYVYPVFTPAMVDSMAARDREAADLVRSACVHAGWQSIHTLLFNEEANGDTMVATTLEYAAESILENQYVPLKAEVGEKNLRFVMNKNKNGRMNAGVVSMTPNENGTARIGFLPLDNFFPFPTPLTSFNMPLAIERYGPSFCAGMASFVVCPSETAAMWRGRRPSDAGDLKMTRRIYAGVQ